MILFLICFFIGASALLFSHKVLNDSYNTERDELKAKQHTAQKINTLFDQALFDIRGYLAFGNTSLRDNALAQDSKIMSLVVQFKKQATSKEDEQFIKNVAEFKKYYFSDTLPGVISQYEAGHTDEVIKLANSQGTARVTEFRQSMDEYLGKLEKDLDAVHQKQIKNQNMIQSGFIIFILIIILVLLRIIRIMLRQIGQPLSQFTLAADLIANGESTHIHVDPNRGDEIGALSAAFHKMAERIQEKEQALKARNEELNSLLSNSEKERKQNQDILNTLHEGVQLIDSKGVTLQMNNKLCEIIECKQHYFVGMNLEQWTTFMQEHVKENEFSENIKQLIELDCHNKNKHSFIYTLKKPFRVINVYSEALFQGNDRIGIVLVHRDITKEYEVDQMKSEFVSTVSHELRTPLASILGFTELMLNRKLKPERQEKYVTTILNEAKRLTSLINDFLDIQRMEAGKQSYDKKYVEILPVLVRVLELQQMNTNRHEIILESSLANPIILGDKAKLEQIYTNLISNAIKYSPKGGKIQVLVSESDQQLKVEVIDNGLGIPEDAIHKLFTKFYRVDNSDRRKIGGTGLGLAIVQEIVKAHDGEITVQSEYGKGSRFTTIFPSVQINPAAMIDDGEEEPANRFRILVVEDDKSLAELISQELWDSGFSVICLRNGFDTMEYLEQDIPDAVVLDILLEDDRYDGWRIMKEMKNHESLKNIPIIVSTALDEKEKGMALGAMDFLIKPYKPSHLSKAIMQTLLKVGKVGQILIPENSED